MNKPSEHRLRILHVSDLHVRGPREREGWRRRRVLGEAWERNLDELVKDGTGVDLVCFTGDVADWGLAAEYGPATEFVEAMLARLGVPKERFFVVPGNHDIQRKVNEAQWSDLRPKLLAMLPKTRSDWLAFGKPPPRYTEQELAEVLAREGGFRDWLEALGLLDLLPENSPHGRLGFRSSLRVRDLPFDVHVIGLDSAWLCGDNADSGKLLLTEDQVARLATDNGNSLPGFRLALVHHPLSDLRDGDACRALLAEHVHLLLRGHLHQEELAEWLGPGQRLRQVAAGCLYEGDEGNTWKNACHLFDVTLDDAGTPKRYDVRLRGFSDRQKGFWFDDGGLYAEAPHGRLTWRVQAASTSVPPPASVRGRVFVGRKDELEKLAEALLPAVGECKPAAICAVQGMPGVGKSYLADQFAIDHATSFPGGAVRLVLQPDEARTAEALLGQLADRLKVVAGSDELGGRVRDRLRAPLTLLHVENVDGAGAAQAVAQLVQWLSGCPVIVTGRYQGLGSTAGWAQVPVAAFDEATALAQLEAELPEERFKAKREALRSLARELGYLPLALHLAASYLREGGYDVETFLGELRGRGLDLDPSDPADRLLLQDPRRANLHKTFALSMELLAKHLGAEAEALIAGLRALGHAPPGGFGRSLGAAIAGLEAGAFSRLAHAAGKLSLLLQVPAEERDDDAWRLHPLLAEWLRQGADEVAVLGRMTEWFVERLPKKKMGEAWWEITREAGALGTWLVRVKGKDVVRVERAGSWYAILNGPFHVWIEFCAQGLEGRSDPTEQSSLLWTLANVALRAGELDRALEVVARKETLDRARGDERGAALAADCRADILQTRGHLDEALRIREEELAVYERVGDVRSRAATMGKIVDIMQARGQLDEALRILREELLPVFERLGDTHTRAVTMSSIANIMQARGQLDEALRIRREELLPVYERLGDVRSRATTMDRIADILQTRGQLDEVLRIRHEELLPVYERLGDIHALLVTRAKLAFNLLTRNAPGDRDQAAHLLQLAHAAAVVLRVPDADDVREIQQHFGLPLTPSDPRP
ncbi:metallophosphoesterase [Polyangium aurulentum]|uniref:metallophosphoesterase n=1 Tax=Polyangium aurulentum TaxID=2567896 RepID=UPI0010ADFA7C|nr:metallophosphoesterase [Polyangium aurulentum]UQA58167.1 metallophosphoesterase [Polyangium aurulentum]